ncbi:MAG: xylulokinase [Oscillospiraceae bacterium]|nr:xylulokinase [Oscillospiraceae bacterium]
MYLLGIDIGTSGTKTVLFDTAGNPIASYTGEYPLYQPKNGYAEQEPLDWWNATVDGIKAVLGKSGADPCDIAGIGLSGQMHGLVMLDKDGKPLRKSIIWCDQRTAAECEEITSAVGTQRLVEITANPALTGFTASKILWVRNNEPEIYEKCKTILLPKDYIRFMLTGERATEVSDASGMQLLDVPNRRWSEEVLDKLSIEKSLLGKVYESPEITGQVTKFSAELTGLKEGTPVAGGAGDNAAAAVGTGVVRDGRGFTTIGTSGVVFAHTDRLSIDKKGRVHTFCAAVPGTWHVMGVTQGAGLSLKWFKDNFCGGELKEAEKQGVDVYYLLDKEAGKVPVGSNRLIYLPYLMGERTPHLDANARGAFFGLSAIHTKYDMLRAVMEGVSFSLKDCLNVLIGIGAVPNTNSAAKRSDCEYSQESPNPYPLNPKPFEMLACGGGGSSALWRQMLSDIFGIDIKTVKSKEGPALGVALLAGVGAGIYKSVPEACDSVIAYSERQLPNNENQKIYEKYYDLYKKLYPALKLGFSELANLP